jgi:uncharacterized membrane protein
MEKETRKELGKLLVDIAKYVITAIIVSSFFKSFGDTWIIYVFGGLTAAVLLIAGFWYLNQSNKKDK